MNKLAALALTLAAFTSPVHAQTLPEMTYTCEEYGTISSLIMFMRQDGYPVNQVIALDGDIIQRRIVVEAYKRPLYYTDAGKALEMREFSNDIMTQCYEKLLR